MTHKLFDGRYVANGPIRNRMHFDNMIDNLPRSTRHPHIGQLYMKLAGRPALIMGAGPSLHDGLDTLSLISSGMVKFCVDAALIPAINHGVIPQFVVTCDPSRETSDFIQGVQPLCWTMLAYEPSCSPAIVREWKSLNCDRFLVTGLSDAGFLSLWGTMERGSVCGSGSAAAMALGLAHFMGCNPIIFAGTEFCWDEGTPSHAHASPAAAHETPEAPFLRLKTPSGKTILTTPSFYRSAWNMNKQIMFHGKDNHFYVGRGGLLGARKLDPEILPSSGQILDWDSIAETKTDWTDTNTAREIRNIDNLMHEIEYHKTFEPPTIVMDLAFEYFMDERNDSGMLIAHSKEYLLEKLQALKEQFSSKGDV